MKIEADGKRIEVDQISLRPSSSIGFSLSELSFQSWTELSFPCICF